MANFHKNKIIQIYMQFQVSNTKRSFKMLGSSFNLFEKKKTRKIIRPLIKVLNRKCLKCNFKL